MPIKEGNEDEAMLVRNNIGPYFGHFDSFLKPVDKSNCGIMSQLGVFNKLPEGHDTSRYLLTGAKYSDVDEYEVFFEQ